MKWTTTEPTRPGRYLVIWKNVFRGDRYISEWVLDEEHAWGRPSSSDACLRMAYTSNQEPIAFARFPGIPKRFSCVKSLKK